MTLILIANLVLALLVFAAFIGLVAKTNPLQPRQRTAGTDRAPGFARLPVPAEV